MADALGSASQWRQELRQTLAESSTGMTASTASTLADLQALSELELQQRVVEPLLRAEGFTHVRDVSGPNERGKDLVAIKRDFGRPKLCAIQIKKARFSGKVAATNSITALVMQLRQMLRESVLDPTTNAQRLPDCGYFITPYPISRQAFEANIAQIGDLERSAVSLI